MPRSKTLAKRPNYVRPENRQYSKAFRARVQRLVFAKMKAHQAAEDAQRQRAMDAAQEKAPGLAAEGSSNSVIPSEDPGPPRMRRLD
jgi:F0F1-type ATP synthase gamma subunit